MSTLPASLRIHRIGVGESEYDSYGNLPPLTMKCNCGSWTTLEYEDPTTGYYRPIDAATRASFIERHANCVATCYRCRVAPVPFQDGWCDSCAAKHQAW